MVWHSSLSSKNRRDIERVQKSAVKIILGNRFSDYEKGLQELNLETLDERRKQICLKFAKNCLRNERVRDMFPLNSQYQMKLRKSRKYKVNKNRTKRYQKSSIPYMQELLNNDAKRRQLLLKEPD